MSTDGFAPNVSQQSTRTDDDSDDRSGDDVAPLPDALDTPRTKLVYLSLREGSVATVDDLKHSLSIPALTLYPVLKTLRERGMIERTDDGYTIPTES